MSRIPLSDRLTVCLACQRALSEHTLDEMGDCRRVITAYYAMRYATTCDDGCDDITQYRIRWERALPGMTLPDKDD